MRKLRLTFCLLMMVVGVALIGTSMLTHAQAQDVSPSQYTGADDCGDCHHDTARDHNHSNHARTLLEADEEDAVLADFSQGQDLREFQFPGEEAPRPFTLDDVAYVLGTGRYAQAYVYEDEDGSYRVFPAEWNTTEGAWQPLEMTEEQATGCISCHTTGFDAESDTWSDDGVQCEACHGPGEAHVNAADEVGRNPSDEDIAHLRSLITVNPGAEACGACHSREDDPANWWSSGQANQPNMQFNEWLTTKHAHSLDDLLASDEAQDACLECHSADYSFREAEIAAYAAGDLKGAQPELLTLDEAENSVTCSACHQTHGDTGQDFGLVESTDALCASCHHDTDLTSDVHHPAEEMYEGRIAFDGVTGSPSTHFSAEDGPECVTCHMPEVAVAGGERYSHAMRPALEIGDNPPPQDTCSQCHTDLSADYLAGFLSSTQAKVTTRLDNLEQSLDGNPNVPQWVHDAMAFVETDGSEGVHNYAYTDALLDAVAVELGVVEAATQNLPQEMRQVIDPTTCEECHREEVRSWQDSPHANASLNDAFLNEYADKGRPPYCMSCHTSGYDPSTGEHQFEGVICTSCHILPNTMEHPPGPVEIARDSAVCGQCHSGAHAPTYDEWLVSDHQVVGVDCVDCHTPHDNGLIRGDVNATCGDCHIEAITDDIHMGQDMTCVDCHMKRRTTEDEVHVLNTGHSMAIDPNVCAECHGNTHMLSVRETNQDQEASNQVAELQAQVSSLEEAADDDQFSGTVGGALGAVIVIFALAMLYRFRKFL